MSIYTQPIQGIYSVLPSAVRTATQFVHGKDIIDPRNAQPFFTTAINPEASGLIAYLNITSAPGAENLILALDEQDPVSGTWAQVVATNANNGPGLMRLKIKPAIQSISAGALQVQIQDTLPATWRIRIAHSSSGNWTYSLGVVLYN
jgi:hypothetical protein